MDSIPLSTIFNADIFDADTATYALTGVCCIVFSYLLFLFSYFEYTLFSLSRNDLAKIVKSEFEGYKSLKYLLTKPEKTMSAIVAGYYLSLIGCIISMAILISWLLSCSAVCTSLYLPIELIASLIVILFLGDVVPLILRNHYRVHLLYLFSSQMAVFSHLLQPLAWPMLRFTSIIGKRQEVKSQHHLSIDELSETLNTDSVQKNEEKEILQGIVGFGNICADEIMRPRVDIVGVEISNKFNDILRVVNESEYSRLPVYEKTIDNVKGILYVKDLLNYIDRDNSFDWQKLVRGPYFVPETKKIDELLKEFQNKHIHMAIVVDEFGGTSGIVTLENILEVIVGDICDEHDEEQKLYTSLDKHNFIIDGKMPLNDFYKIDEVDKSVFADYDSDADTIAGLLLEIKGDIPTIGEKIEIKEYKFQIISADNRRIKKVKLQIQDSL